VKGGKKRHENRRRRNGEVDCSASGVKEEGKRTDEGVGECERNVEREEVNIFIGIHATSDSFF
jgi:hypothetical protein